MGRCKGCSTCLDVAAYRRNNTGKRNTKKVKRYETANPCTNHTTSIRKRKLTELESLHSAGHGGQVRGEIYEAPTLTTTDRAARPKSTLQEPQTFNSDDFDEYCDLVRQCTTVAKQSKSTHVKAEAPSMLSKMRRLLHPSVKYEVDFAEATQDSSNIYRYWIKGEAAGTAAFIPDIGDRDACYSALKIFSCAADEAKLIPQEYVEMFGEDDGIGIYNGLIELIGEREKQCLPLINMCLRAWMDKLSVDMDLWADLSPLDFDKWLADAMTTANIRGYRGKSSYEMMMAIFGEEDSATGKDTTIISNQPTSSGIKTASSNTSNHTTMSPNINVMNTSNQRPIRISKVQKIGQVLQEALICSSALCSRYHTHAKADARIQEAVKAAVEGDLNTNSLRRCREAAQKMEEILFTVGGAERLIATLRYFKDQPAVRELLRAREVVLQDGTSSNVMTQFLSKDEKLSALIVAGLKGFVGMFRRQRGDGDRGGGRRSDEDQNAYDSVLAALVSGKLNSAKLGTMLSRKLDISRRQIRRGRARRKNMEDMDNKHWVRKSSAVPKSAIGEGKHACN